MVLTPFHIGFILPLWLKFRRLDLPALALGSMLPDFEIPFILLLTSGLTDRMVMHSLFGSLILGVPVTLLVVFFVMPKLVSFLSRKTRLVSLPFISPFLNRKPAPLSISFLSALIGIWSHVLMDSLIYHGTSKSPFLWPFSNQSFVFPLFGSPLFSLVFWTGLSAFLLVICLRALAKVG